MRYRQEHGISDWLGKALCRRYALVHFTDFHLSVLKSGGHHSRPWCWALAMFAPDEFEILGTWPADTSAVGSIAEDLWNRGILSIRVVSIADGKNIVPQLSRESWMTALQDAEPRVLEIIAPQSISGEAVEGVPSAAIRSALNAAARIHGSLVRSARSRPPFASAAAASEFVADWLQRADQRLYQVRRPPRPVVAHAA